MNSNTAGPIVTDTIDADQIEVGDQIVIDGEHIECDRVDDLGDEGIQVSGFSWDEGDRITASLPYDYRVDLWSL